MKGRSKENLCCSDPKSAYGQRRYLVAVACAGAVALVHALTAARAVERALILADSERVLAGIQVVPIDANVP